MNQKPYKQPLRERNQVELKCMTWEKDSHGLFDYESQSIQTEKHRVENACQIVRQDNKQIKIVEINERIEEENCRVLACITQKDSISPSYFINPTQQSSSSDSNTSGTSSTDALGKINISGKDNTNNDAFLIVRFMRNQKGEQKGYPLQVGDMIKLGRVEYCVIEKNTKEGGLQQINDIFCDQEQYNFNIDCAKTETLTCRICLCEEEQSSENPLLNPCNCKGSCEYMHFDCLKHWVESKVHKKTFPIISTYKWKNLECEVCKQPLPKIININNKKLPLVEIPRPEGNYIILESISREKKVSMGLYIIHNLNNEEDSAKLGRGHTCDIRVQDISVSRFHSYIKYENGQFLLFDNNSKFGTLVKLEKNYPILSEKVGIQVGRTVLTFSLKPPIPSNINQLQQSIQQSVAQFDRVTMNNSQKQKQLIIEQQQQLLQMAQQFKNANIPSTYTTTNTQNINNTNSNNNNNNNNNIINNPGMRIPTNTNLPSQNSNVITNINVNAGSSQQQKNNLQTQMITSSSAMLDKLQKNNGIKQPNKGNAFVSNAANNIIGSNSSQVQNANNNVMGNSQNRNNIQAIVLPNGSMTNFNSSQYKVNDMPLMNNFQVINSNSNVNTNNNNNSGGSNNNGMYASSHVMGANNRNSSNTTHYNEFPNYNSMVYGQSNYHNLPANFTSTLYNNNNSNNIQSSNNNNNNIGQNGNSSSNNNAYSHYSVQQQQGSTLIQRNNRNHH